MFVRAGLCPDSSDRIYMLDDYRPDLRSGGSSMDLDPGRCSPPLPPSSLPHECQVCGKLISCRRNLWKHMERVHLTNPAVKCSICAKLFKNKYALKDHQRIYHGGLSEPLPPSPHHQHQSHSTLLNRILRDVRTSGLPSGGSSAPMPRPSSCSIIPEDSRPPRELAPIPHTVPHHGLEPMGSQFRRRHMREDEELGAGGSVSNSSRYLDNRTLLPPPPHSSSSSFHTSNSPGIPGSSNSRRDWNTQETSSMSVSSNHPLFSELHNLPSKSTDWW